MNRFLTAGILVFGILLSGFQSTAQSQQQKEQGLQTWKTLSKIKIEKKFDEDFEFEIDYPVFSEEIKNLSGKEVLVSGYLIPLEEFGGNPNFFVLSSLPYNNCFFCGGGGPETVMEIYGNEKLSFTNDLVVLKGKLELNADDPFRLIYILKEAKQVK